MNQKPNKNFSYWIRDILLWIFFPLRMTFFVCPYCQTVRADIVPCKCEREEYRLKREGLIK